MKMQDDHIKQRMDTLQQYVSDMIAVEQHIGDALKRQQGDSHVYEHNPQAARLIQQIASMTEQHEEHLKQHLKALGGDPAKGIKELAASALGAVAGMYDKIRTESVSKMLRDDYTALNLAAVSYTMLHTTGLALQDQVTADLALRHLQHYSQLIMEINRVIPHVVLEDLREHIPGLTISSAEQAVANTQRAWQPSASAIGGAAGSGMGSHAI
ncbi:MAG TPA: hypothetical protein VNK95_14140 [Caldilineaceae bacterium]|nr:hypothetical protein [Caldilineaceae bacterium]